MRELSVKNAQVIAGGVYSNICYEAYKSQTENRGIGDLFGILFLPFLYLPVMTGEILAVKNICGSWEAYDEAKAAYCQVNPRHCEHRNR
jgi:hypothetical protein